MYVPFGKSVDDVTFRLSLRQLFLTRLKKTMEHNHTNFFNILCFSCQGKSRDIVYQRACLFSWLIFAKHGLFGIQITA